MTEKTYTREEAKVRAARFIEEQARILEENLRKKRATASQFEICIK